MKEPTGWHGFQDWLDFMKATLSLGGVLTLGLWAVLTFAMDARYALATDVRIMLTEAVDQIKYAQTENQVQDLDRQIAITADRLRHTGYTQLQISLQNELAVLVSASEKYKRALRQ